MKKSKTKLFKKPNKNQGKKANYNLKEMRKPKQ